MSGRRNRRSPASRVTPLGKSGVPMLHRLPKDRPKVSVGRGQYPRSTSSTRWICARPASVLLLAAGAAKETPIGVRRARSMAYFPVEAATTAAARQVQVAVVVADVGAVADYQQRSPGICAQVFGDLRQGRVGGGCERLGWQLDHGRFGPVGWAWTLGLRLQCAEASLSPMMPMTMRPTKKKRARVAGSWNSSSPSTKVPTAPMPVQTA